jgi:hypothetical protein
MRLNSGRTTTQSAEPSARNVRFFLKALVSFSR